MKEKISWRVRILVLLRMKHRAVDLGNPMSSESMSAR
jgi:hypothetical protein